MQLGVSGTVALIGRVCNEEHRQTFLRLQSLPHLMGFAQKN